MIEMILGRFVRRLTRRFIVDMTIVSCHMGKTRNDFSS
jgi:hypothetical protein